MSKPREWNVMYQGRWDTGISYTACMPYRDAQREAARLRRDGARWVEIVQSDFLRERRLARQWADAILGGSPPIA